LQDLTPRGWEIERRYKVRFLARVLIALGSVAVIVGFFLPFFSTNPATFWEGTSSADSWKFWLTLAAAGLSLILMIAPSKVMGLIHLALGGGMVYLIYLVLGSPELQSLFGSWTNFQSFISGLGYGGYLVVGGAVAVFLGGIFEIAS
jgi:hypothetical protein